MSEPINNSVEIIEENSVNKFIWTIKGSGNQEMHGSGDWLEWYQRHWHQEKDLWCIYLLKVVLPSHRFLLSVAQHPEGSTVLTFSGQHFHIIFITKA